MKKIIVTARQLSEVFACLPNPLENLNLTPEAVIDDVNGFRHHISFEIDYSGKVLEWVPKGVEITIKSSNK